MYILTNTLLVAVVMIAMGGISVDAQVMTLQEVLDAENTTLSTLNGTYTPPLPFQHT